AGSTFKRSAGAGLAEFDTTFTNNGMVDVQTGTLRMANGLTNFNGTTLTGGQFTITTTMQFSATGFTHNASAITMNGPTAKLVNMTGGVDALATCTTNDAGGTLTFQDGNAQSLAVNFTNLGAVTVKSGASLSAAGKNYVEAGGTTTVDGSLT